MAKRKKYPKLPNGFGSIKYLGKGRRNPYAVHPPTTEFTLEGIPKTPKALCYVDDYMKGFAVLTAYKAGTYTPGMERDIEISGDNLDSLAQSILADYSRSQHMEPPEKKLTFAEVYEKFYWHKYERPGAKKLSEQSRKSTIAAFKNCREIHNAPFADLRYPQLQAVVDGCPLKHASLELIVSLMHQMYKYALSYEIVDRDYSATVKIGIPDDDEHGVPFTDEELGILWEHRKESVPEMLIIMCYTGFRISEYRNMEINLKEKYLRGGSKTEAGKNRVVPIHSGIYRLVCARMRRYGCLLDVVPTTFRQSMYNTLAALRIGIHTPHDTRHTFNALCDKYRVDERDKKLMLGHAFTDVTNRVYMHRNLEDLREEIEKIEICY